MGKGEGQKSGWASFRPQRKEKLSRQSASRRPPNQNSKVSCERLARLVSLSLDVSVRLEVRRKVRNNCHKEERYVDSKVSPKFRFTRGVGAGSARRCRCRQVSVSSSLRWMV